MEKNLGLMLWLAIFIIIPSWILYSNHQYRKRLKASGLPPQPFLGAKFAQMDFSKRASSNHPLVFTGAMVIFGLTLLLLDLPFFGAGFVILFGTLFVGYLFGWAVRAPKEHTDSVVNNSGQYINDLRYLSESNKSKVPKTYRFFVYLAMILMIALFVTQALVGPFSLIESWPSILVWFI